MPSRAYLGSDLPLEDLLVPTQQTPPQHPPGYYAAPPEEQEEEDDITRLEKMVRERSRDPTFNLQDIRRRPPHERSLLLNRLAEHAHTDSEYETVHNLSQELGVASPFGGSVSHTDIPPENQAEAVERSSNISREYGVPDMAIEPDIGVNLYDYADQITSPTAGLEVDTELGRNIYNYVANPEDVRVIRDFVARRGGRYAPETVNRAARDDELDYELRTQLLNDLVNDPTITSEQLEALRRMASAWNMHLPTRRQPDLSQPIGKLGTGFLEDQRREEERNPRPPRPEPKIYYPPDREIDTTRPRFVPDR